MKKLLPLVVFAFVLTASSQAFAIRGASGRQELSLQGGILISGGSVKSKQGESTWVSSDRKLDGGFSLGLAYGINHSWVINLEALWIGMLQKPHDDITTLYNNFGFLAGPDFFIYKGIVVGANVGLGLMYNKTWTEIGNHTVEQAIEQYGFGMKVSAGYEALMSNSLAGGIRFYFFGHFGEKAQYNTFGANIYVRWF